MNITASPNDVFLLVSSAILIIKLHDIALLYKYFVQRYYNERKFVQKTDSKKINYNKIKYDEIEPLDHGFYLLLVWTSKIIEVKSIVNNIIKIKDGLIDVKLYYKRI